MKTLFFLFCCFVVVPFLNAQNDRIVLVCEQGKGCEQTTLGISDEEADVVLSKTNWLTQAPKNAILVLNLCFHYLEEKKNINQIHAEFGGSNTPQPIANFTLSHYKEIKNCGCPNSTKRIEFSINAKDFNGSAYYFHNFQKQEAFMPNDAYQKLFANSPDKMNAIVNSIFKNDQFINYIDHPEVGKIQMSMPIGVNVFNAKGRKMNLEYFESNFEKQKETRKSIFSLLPEISYKGIDMEGNMMTIWLAPVADVCLSSDIFDSTGAFALGYLNIHQSTYLITEISASDLEIKATKLSEGSYNFNPTGYQTLPNF